MHAQTQGDDFLPVSISGFGLPEIYVSLKSENLENLKAENRALGCKVRSVKINLFPQNCSISSYQTVAEAHEGLHRNFPLNKGMSNDLGCVISAKHG